MTRGPTASLGRFRRNVSEKVYQSEHPRILSFIITYKHTVLILIMMQIAALAREADTNVGWSFQDGT
jgi:hypothetical protein